MTSSNTNQYGVGYEDSLPGAFPETPADESGPPQHNKLHKRDDPRGFTDSNSTPRTSHGHTDSGVSAVSGVSSSTPNSNSNSNSNSNGNSNSNSNSNSTARGGNYTYEKNGLPDRTRTQDQQQQPYASQEQGASKPGFMTGAFSRVGNNHNSNEQPTTTTDSAAARQPTSTSNPLSSSSHVQRDTAGTPETTSSGRHIHIKGGDPATVPGGAAATSNSPSASAPSEEGQQRNLVRNGRGRSDVDHEEAYWGDIPRGAGVYNTVVGAGSDEKNPATAHPQDRSLQHAPAQHLAARDGTSASNLTPQWRNEGVGGENNGVHNSIIGTGSAEDRSSVSHHREFPLVGGSSSSSPKNGTTGTGAAHHTHHQGDTTALHDESTSKSHAKSSPSSHFKEHLAEAGVAGAGTGYAADKYAQGREGNHPTAAASGVSPSQQQQQQYSKPSTTQAHLAEMPGSQPAEQDTQHQHHLGRDAALAGAGAAAGAAGYGTHKYNDNHEKQNAYPNSHNDPASAYQTGNPYSGEHTSSVPSAGQKQNDTYLKYGPAEAAAATGVGAGYGTHTPSPQQGYTSSAYAQKDLSATARGNDNDSHFGRNAALAGAGAGAAGYGAHKYAHRDDDNVNNTSSKGYASQPQQQTTSTRHSQPTVTTGTEQRTVPAETTDSSRNHRNDAKYAAAGTAAGVGAGAAAYNVNKKDHHTTTPAESQRQQAGKYNTLADGTRSGVNLDRSSQNPAATAGSRTTAAQDHPNDAKYAAAGAASGLGAGAIAYKANKGQDHTAAPAEAGRKQAGAYNTLGDGTPSGVNLDRSAQQGNTTTANPNSNSNSNNPKTSHTGRNTAAAAGAAGAAGAGAYAAHGYASSGTKQPQATPSAHRQHNASVSSHSSADSSHGGQYNVLSSGTPSGINISGDPHQHESPQTLVDNSNTGGTGSRGRDAAPAPARHQ